MLSEFLRISPDGTQVTSLYDEEKFSSKAPGIKTIVRASDVKFNNEKGKWYVHQFLPGKRRLVHPQGFIKRKDAIAFEVKLLGKLLMENPSSVNALINEG